MKWRIGVPKAISIVNDGSMFVALCIIVSNLKIAINEECYKYSNETWRICNLIKKEAKTIT
jgi:hypothetical protein